MVEQFLNHIQRHNLCKTNDKILLAVSGGIDSIVMAHLFITVGFSVAVAHCNFQLRGEASNDDEAFVNMFCVDHKIPFHVRRFETASIAAESGESIQVCARKLRYDFFNQLYRDHGYNYVATGHHLDDNIETILLNLTRGTGIDGLAGIPVKVENIIRPLLFASRSQIHDYAAFHRLAWREDESNAGDDYARNVMRHHVVPKLMEVNPGLHRTFQNTIERLGFSGDMSREHIRQISERYCKEVRDQLHIDKKILREVDHPEVLLWELLKSRGFNYEQCKLIPRLDSTGKRIFSGSHSLTSDREVFIIASAGTNNDSVTIMPDTLSVAGHGRSLGIAMEPVSTFRLSLDKSLAQLDMAKVQFPITWRRWRAGDSFRPFGMSHSKKVSDFLIDLKVSLPDKDHVTVLESAGEIIWVVGFRIDDRYKVTQKTSEVLIIEVNAV